MSEIGIAGSKSERERERERGIQMSKLTALSP